MKTCDYCKSTWEGTRNECFHCGHTLQSTSLPTPKEIEELTEEIRQGWSEVTRRRRAGQGEDEGVEIQRLEGPSRINRKDTSSYD